MKIVPLPGSALAAKVEGVAPTSTSTVGGFSEVQRQLKTNGAAPSNAAHVAASQPVQEISRTAPGAGTMASDSSISSVALWRREISSLRERRFATVECAVEEIAQRVLDRFPPTVNRAAELKVVSELLLNDPALLSQVTRSVTITGER